MNIIINQSSETSIAATCTTGHCWHETTGLDLQCCKCLIVINYNTTWYYPQEA